MAFNTDLHFDPGSWAFTTDWERVLDETSESLVLEGVNSGSEDIFTRTQLETPSTPPSKKRTYSTYASEENESRKKMKLETLLSEPSAKIDLLGAKLFNPDHYPQCTKEELNRYRTAAELETFEKWLNIDPPTTREGYYYTAQVQNLPSHLFNPPQDGITILTGKLDEHPIPPDASERLRKNLNTARLVIDEVRNAIPFSQNYFQRSKIFTQEYFDPNCVNNLNSFFKESCVTLYSKVYPPDPLESIVKETLNHKIANCAHLACLGYFLTGQEVPVDYVAIGKGNHMLLIYDSDKDDSDKAFPGPHSVFCDLWSGAFFPGSDIKFLMDFKGHILCSGMQYTKVQKFDPSKQFLRYLNLHRLSTKPFNPIILPGT